MSGRALVDSSAYYALAAEGDDNHATAIASRLAHEGAGLYTTNYVIAETHGLILNRMNRDIAQRVLERLSASTTRIIRATEHDERRAWEIIRQQSDKEYSLVDAISFAVMERLHICNVWTYDHHFAQYGLKIEL